MRSIFLKLFFLLSVWGMSIVPADAKDKVVKTAASPLVEFLGDIYRTYESMSGVLQLKTFLYRHKMESLHTDRLWSSLTVDPASLYFPYRAFIAAEPYAVLSADFRLRPFRFMDVRLIITAQPNTYQNVEDSEYDAHEFQKIQTGATFSIAEHLQIISDFTYSSSWYSSRFSNDQGNLLGVQENGTERQRYVTSFYNSRSHSLSFEIRPLKNNIFEPRFKLKWGHSQVTYALAENSQMDPYVRMGNTTSTSDGFNGEDKKNSITLSAGFTLRPHASIALTGGYALTPSEAETDDSVQSFTTHQWSLLLDFRLNRHVRFNLSFSLARSVYLHQSPYTSTFWDYTMESQDVLQGSVADNSLLRRNERFMDKDALMLMVEYR